MKKATIQKIICATLILLGVGLCIGGIWVPLLLVGGVPTFAAGLGVLADIVDTKDRYTFNNNCQHQESHEGTINSTRAKQIQELLFRFNSKNKKSNNDIRKTTSTPNLTYKTNSDIELTTLSKQQSDTDMKLAEHLENIEHTIQIDDLSIEDDGAGAGMPKLKPKI